MLFESVCSVLNGVGLLNLGIISFWDAWRYGAILLWFSSNLILRMTCAFEVELSHVNFAHLDYLIAVKYELLKCLAITSVLSCHSFVGV